MSRDRSVSRRDFLKGAFAWSHRVDEAPGMESPTRLSGAQPGPEWRVELERVLEQMNDLSGIVEP